MLFTRGRDTILKEAVGSKQRRNLQQRQHHAKQESHRPRLRLRRAPRERLQHLQKIFWTLGQIHGLILLGMIRRVVQLRRPPPRTSSVAVMTLRERELLALILWETMTFLVVTSQPRAAAAVAAAAGLVPQNCPICLALLRCQWLPNRKRHHL